MKKAYQCLLGGIVFFSHLCFAGSSDYTITYKNTTGSTLTLTWHPDSGNSGTVNGMLTSGIGGCRQANNLPVVVTGVFTGNAVAMTVNYPKCNKVVAITGNKTKETLQTFWMVTSPVKEYSGDGLGAYSIGSDSYTQVAS